MSQSLVITLAERGNPRHILGYFDASRAHFSTDPRRAVKFEDLGSACAALGHLRVSHPSQAEWISVRSEPQAQPRTTALAWCFVVGLALASLTSGCSHAPLSASGLTYQGTFILPSEVWIPPDPPPAELPDLIWRVDPLQMP
jgi:hypothetical protein